MRQGNKPRGPQTGMRWGRIATRADLLRSRARDTSNNTLVAISASFPRMLRMHESTGLTGAHGSCLRLIDATVERLPERRGCLNGRTKRSLVFCKYALMLACGSVGLAICINSPFPWFSNLKHCWYKVILVWSSCQPSTVSNQRLSLSNRLDEPCCTEPQQWQHGECACQQGEGGGMGKCRHDRRGKRARGNGGGRAPRRAPLALKLASTRKVRALARGRTCASDARPTWHHKACVHRFFARRHAEAFAFDRPPGVCLGASLASPA